MQIQQLYNQICSKRSQGIDYQMVYHWKRQDPELWALTRERVWKRDHGVCQSPKDTAPKLHGLCQQNVALKDCHIDHIKPLSSGGSNHACNLRTLCPVCHGLRLDEKHRSLTTQLVKKGLIPVQWKHLTWF